MPLLCRRFVMYATSEKNRKLQIQTNFIHEYSCRIYLRQPTINYKLQARINSPVWILMWSDKEDLWRNDWLHKLQTNGFSPNVETIFKCLSSDQNVRDENVSHLPVWIIKCLRNNCFLLKDLSHISHVKGFSPIGIFVKYFNSGQDSVRIISTTYQCGSVNVRSMQIYN